MAGFALNLPVGAAAQASRPSPIILTWLVRLRWLAVAGQVVAVAVAVWGLRLQLHIWPIAAIIAFTALSNVPVWLWTRTGSRASWLTPTLVILDIALLTALLYFTGGSHNPFAALYLVHVAMAVVVLRPVWTWSIVALVTAAYGFLFWFHTPAGGLPLAQTIASIGSWIALVLVAVLIAYFSGRITRSLRRRERQLAELREQAHRNERLAALTTLSAGAAHELGTPLATIAVVAKELELACSGSANRALAEDARLIRQEVDRCRAIIDRMRGQIVDRPGAYVGSRSLGATVEHVLEDLSSSQKRRLEIQSDCDLDLEPIAAAEVQQALTVLLRNAFDAGREDDRVKLTIHRNNGDVCFEVEDRGCGMSGDVLSRVGEPFFTTKPPGKGMGLGLFLVRLVAERFGGKLRLDSHPGSGTRCTLELPHSEVGTIL